MSIKTITLKPGERIVAVVPERCSGPGWGNMAVRVYIQKNDGQVFKEYLQSNELTADLFILFNVGEALHKSLIDAVPVKRIKD
jgi:hypothetical protein